jgi:hypothetical protein
MAALVEYSVDFAKERDEAIVTLVEVDPFCDGQSAPTRQ